MEAFGVWWPPWSSKPVTRITRVVGSIPIRFRHILCSLLCSLKIHNLPVL